MTGGVVLAAAAASLGVLLIARPRPRRPVAATSPRTVAFPRPRRFARRSRGAPAGGLRSGDVPLAADLVVAALEAGVPLWAAVEAAGQAVGADLGAMLIDVRRRQQVGSDAASATAPLAAHPATERMGRALGRAASSGASPVQILASAADSERDRLRSQAVAKARSAGALAALPVGLLFLPAFVLVAVVPVVVGSLTAMLGSG